MILFWDEEVIIPEHQRLFFTWNEFKNGRNWSVGKVAIFLKNLKNHQHCHSEEECVDVYIKKRTTKPGTIHSVKGEKGRLIQSYSFTKILRPELGQQELFTSLVRPMVKDFMEGQNQLLFTYGATSAGKTWTMQGDMGNSGIIPRSLDTVFNTIGSQISATVPVQPVGFNRVVGISQGELDTARKDKEAVFRLGLDLNKKTGGGRLSPDISTPTLDVVLPAQEAV